jgi:hypothetical protein
MATFLKLFSGGEKKKHYFIPSFLAFFFVVLVFYTLYHLLGFNKNLEGFNFSNLC